jgi:hypothetical protein
MQTPFGQLLDSSTVGTLELNPGLMASLTSRTALTALYQHTSCDDAHAMASLVNLRRLRLKNDPPSAAMMPSRLRCWAMPMNLVSLELEGPIWEEPSFQVSVDTCVPFVSMSRPTESMLSYLSSDIGPANRNIQPTGLTHLH